MSLSNTDNYRERINVSFFEIIDSYLKIICEYMILLSENEYIKNIGYFKFILVRGLETITTIFRLILFFTKNITLANYHSQKALYVYIEFIEQISDVQNSFLQLSSRDAVLFVYKKTIYEINNEYRKKIKEENNETNLFEKMNDYLNIMKNIICFYLQIFELTNNNKQENIRIYCESLQRYTRLLYNNTSNISNNKSNISNTTNNMKKKVECIQLCIDKIADINTEENVITFFELFDFFMKHVSKNIDISMYDKVLEKIGEIRSHEDIRFICNNYFTNT
jgi:hypothetical protein